MNHVLSGVQFPNTGQLVFSPPDKATQDAAALELELAECKERLREAGELRVQLLTQFDELATEHTAAKRRIEELEAKLAEPITKPE